MGVASSSPSTGRGPADLVSGVISENLLFTASAVMPNERASATASGTRLDVMTGVDCPAAFLTTTVLAKGSPVFSSTGSASSSVRSITVGPVPFRSTATMPVLPTPVVTSNPNAFTRAASLALVCSS